MKPEEIIRQAEKACSDAFERFEQIEYVNTKKVLDAFKAHEVSYRFFAPTTGYGYDDIGRDTLSELFAGVDTTILDNRMLLTQQLLDEERRRERP